MPRITFVEFSGIEHVVNAEIGTTVMQAATQQGVPGIIGDCGGNCSCATCHVYIDAAWRARISPPAAAESEMIEFVLHRKDESRLGCQISIFADLDGLVVHLPESQT
jgi:2Fe-2S ferredoxin